MSFAEFGFSETTFAGNNTNGGFVALSVDFIITHDVLAENSQEFIINYAVKNGTEQEFILNHDVVGILLVDTIISYEVVAGTQQEFIIGYQIDGSLYADFTINSQILNDVSQDYIIRNNVSNRDDAIIINNKICPSKRSRTLKIRG